MPTRNPCCARLLREHCQVDADGWTVCAGLTFSQAEALLDWLEVCGCSCQEVRPEATGVTLRWRWEAAEPVTE